MDTGSVLIVEDDPTWTECYTKVLKWEYGFNLHSAQSLAEAVRLLKRNHYTVAVIDYYFARPQTGDICALPDDGPLLISGLDLAKHITRNHPAVNILLVTQAPELTLSSTEIQMLRTKGIEVHYKRDISPTRLAQLVKRARDRSQLRVLIVHGRDLHALEDLRSYLKTDLGLQDIVVVKDTASGGMTLIEKWEQCVADVDVAFVLCTPDDIGGLRNAASSAAGRARQNVIFELGFLVARLGRSRNRVVLLTKGDIELPSDISGMIRIDISEGVRSVGGLIKAELDAVF